MKKGLYILLFLTMGAFSQEYKTAFSAYTSTDYTKGFELRGEFEEWYIAFHAENFIKNKEFNFKWGFALGAFQDINKFTYYYGINLGFLVVEGHSKPLIGLEIELDYNINNNLYVGVRGSYDTYFDSPNVETPKSYTLIRPFIKIGYKF